MYTSKLEVVHIQACWRLYDFTAANKMDVIWTMKGNVVTKISIELLGQLKRDRMVLFPLTDKILVKLR